MLSNGAPSPKDLSLKLLKCLKHIDRSNLGHFFRSESRIGETKQPLLFRHGRRGKLVSRVALLPIPGTAATASGTSMTIEAIEIKGIKSRPYNPPLSDPGATYLKLIVSDLDKTLALLKSERVPVITAGENPVELSGWPGMGGKVSRSNAPVFIGPTTRSFFVPDPQGFWLEFMDHDVQRDPTAK